MAKRIGVLEADEPLNAEPRKHVSKTVALYLVRKALAIGIGPRLIKMLQIKLNETTYAHILFDGPIGIGNVLPFSLPTDPQRHSHYEIPMAGDRTCFMRHRRKLLRPSKRRWRHLGAPVITVAATA